MKILVVNAGSSSHKLSLYDMQSASDSVEPLWKGILDWGRRENNAFIRVQTHTGYQIEKRSQQQDRDASLKQLLETMWQGESQVIEKPSSIEKVGHRVVHGGKFHQPALITAQVKEEIRRLIPLAPLHNPANLEGIELMEKIFPGLPQIAVFDTAFHAHMPEIAKTYPLPYDWKTAGIQRYGFHGISHHYCAERAAKMVGKQLSELKIINCHLGNGSSLCAIHRGVSIDTTMGFTPLEGLMMGTRCGSIDPGIIFYLLREKGIEPEKLDYLLNFESGLKGISGTSDMRTLLQQSDEKSKLAFDMYVYRLKSYIGALITHLEGADVISFTAGIGENVPSVRQAACTGLAFLGIELDSHQNTVCKPDQKISTARSQIQLLVIHTQEEWMIARQCLLMS